MPAPAGRARAVAALVLVLGIAGLWRGTVIAGTPDGAAPAASTSASTTAGAAGIAITGATITASPGPTTALRLVIRNDTGQDDRLLSISSGAGESVILAGGGASGIPATGIALRAGATVTIGDQITATISGMLGPLVAGQHVAVAVELATAGAVLVEAIVQP
jgi:copper(I)-binding protein